MVDNREALEEDLRQVVLEGGDEEALLAAEVFGEDLEVWEVALRALPEGDPRHALVQARVQRIRRGWGVEA